MTRKNKFIRSLRIMIKGIGAAVKVFLRALDLGSDFFWSPVAAACRAIGSVAGILSIAVRVLFYGLIVGTITLLDLLILDRFRKPVELNPRQTAE